MDQCLGALSIRRPRHLFARWAICCMVGGSLALGWGATPARADDLREVSALKSVPADASFFSASLRRTEQWDRIAKSRAVTRLLAQPYVQIGLGFLQNQWDSNDHPVLVQVRDFVESDEGQVTVKFLQDAVSKEVFVYGGTGHEELFNLLLALQGIQTEMNFDNIEQLIRSGGMSGDRGALDPEAAMAENSDRLVQRFAELIKKTKVPESVLGFRISSAKTANNQLKSLEKLLQRGVGQLPKELTDYVSVSVSREKIGGADFLRLAVEIKQVPVEQLDALDLPAEAAKNFETLLKQFEGTKFAIGFGVVGDYLLVGSGPSLAHVAKFGKGPLLVDRPEMQFLKKLGDQRVMGVSYVSQPLSRYMDASAQQQQQLDQLAVVAERISGALEFPAEQTQALRQTLTELSESAKRWSSQPGAVGGALIMTGRGIESLTYNYGSRGDLDGTKPLTLLSQLGGDPIFFAASRAATVQEKQEQEQMAGMKKLLGQLDQMVVTKLNDEQKTHYKAAKEEFLPLANRLIGLNPTWKEAFADNQTAIVISANAQSKAWHANMPPANAALPMLDIACVSTVTDRAKVKSVARSIFEILQETANAFSRLSQGEIPVITLSGPNKSVQMGDQEQFMYDLPEELGLDEQVGPNALLTKNLLVMSLMPETSKRMAKSTPLAVGGILSNPSQPMASAARFNFAGLVDAIVPWGNYAIDMATTDLNAPLRPGGRREANPMAASFKSQMKLVTDYLKCFRGYTTYTTQDGDAWVTRSEWHFADLEE